MNKKEHTDSNEPKLFPRSIKLTQAQLDFLQKQAKISGTSVAGVIRQACFQGGIKQPLMTKEDQKHVISQLRRIGNNINQIAKALNSGFRAGFHDEVEQMRDQFYSLYAYVAGIEQSRKKRS